MAEASAEVLHNTPAISRSSYIHPEIIALADKGELPETEVFRPLVEPLRGPAAQRKNRLLDFLIRRSAKQDPMPLLSQGLLMTAGCNHLRPAAVAG